MPREFEIMSKLRLKGSATKDAMVKRKLIWNEVLGRAVGLTTQNRKDATMSIASSAKRIAGLLPFAR